jgi:hypothetical protein
VLVEQSRPELLWPVDIILRASGNAVLSGRWRTFALGHRLHVGDHLVFRFKLGMLEASVRIFATAGVRRTYPQPTAECTGGLATVALWGGKPVSFPLLRRSLCRRGMPRLAPISPPRRGLSMKSSH